MEKITTPSEPIGISSKTLYQLQEMVDDALPGSLREEALESFIKMRWLDAQPDELPQATKLFLALLERFDKEPKFHEAYRSIEDTFRGIVSQSPQAEQNGSCSRFLEVLDEYWRRRTSRLIAGYQSRNSAVS